jgi:hypothetical protein
VYLKLKPIDGCLRPVHFDVDADPTLGRGETSLPISEEGFALIDLWWWTPSAKDHLLSGVLADWLQDHLLTGATGPDPAERL